MQVIHAILADSAVVAVVVAVAWASVLALRGRSAGGAFRRFQTFLIGVLVLAAIAGAANFASGARPSDGLHLLYGGVAIVLIPLAGSFLGGGAKRDRLITVATVVGLAGVLYRLFATG